MPSKAVEFGTAIPGWNLPAQAGRIASVRKRADRERIDRRGVAGKLPGRPENYHGQSSEAKGQAACKSTAESQVER
jgi:hypothetical protein